MRTRSRRLRNALLAGFALEALACGGEEQTANAAGEVATRARVPNAAPVIESLQLVPAEPRPGDMLVAQVRAADANGDAIALAYAWRVDGETQAETRDRIQVKGARGSLIEVEVTPQDADSRGESVSATAEIQNLPPVIEELVLWPRSGAVPGRKLSAHPKASDVDGDTLDFEFAWFVNGNQVDGNRGPLLDPKHFSSGNEIRVRVVASDGFETSEPWVTDPIVVGNAPPAITSAPPEHFDEDGTFRYVVRVEDPDDASFRFKLLQGPEGMEIDLFDGRLTWAPVEAQVGRHPVKVEVSDRKSAATQSFAVDVGVVTLPAAESR